MWLHLAGAGPGRVSTALLGRIHTHVRFSTSTKPQRDAVSTTAAVRQSVALLARLGW
jgi:hypothetical protein